MMAELFRSLVPTIMAVADNTRTEVTIQSTPTNVHDKTTDLTTTTWANSWTGLVFIYDSEESLTTPGGAIVKTREVIVEAAVLGVPPTESSKVVIGTRAFDVLRVDTDPATAAHILFIAR